MSAPSFIECNGVAMRYLLSGDGPSTVVLVHELGGSLNSWDDMVPLLPAGRRVLRYDMRGAGMSQKVSGTLDIDDLADDLECLLEALGITPPATVVGAAVGAAVAVRFAARHAGLCDRAVLISPALGVPPERHAAALAIADRLDAEGMQAVAGDVLPKALPEALWTNGTDKSNCRARWLGADPHGYAAAYRMLVHAVIRADLAKIRCPVLTLAGRLDPFATPELVREAVSAIEDGRFEIVEGGHFMSIQNPDRVAAAMASFLDN
jgi:pimeloyl-ACP methyl ester carboxylesterase